MKTVIKLLGWTPEQWAEAYRLYKEAHPEFTGDALADVYDVAAKCAPWGGGSERFPVMLEVQVYWHERRVYAPLESPLLMPY